MFTAGRAIRLAIFGLGAFSMAARMGHLAVSVRRAAIRSLRIAVALAACGIPPAAIAMDSSVVVVKKSGEAPILQPYEPITGGYTHDSEDTGFMDVNLSLKIRLLPWNPTSRWHVFPYFAMATRFGFYWYTRPKSPAIGKSYNPLLMIRLLTTSTKLPDTPNGLVEHVGYVDFIPYAHESNGQVIHTQDVYNQELAALKATQTPPLSMAEAVPYTNNYIHRGWDYIGAVWKQSWHTESEFTTYTTYVEGRYFIPYGLLQGREDEYHSWESNPQGKPRKAVDGLSATIDYPSHFAHFAVDPATCDPSEPELNRVMCKIRPNITVKYVTGYDTPFRYSTERVELGFQVSTLPLALWFQHGYMSSLAMYYVKVTSVGLELRFNNF